MRHDRVLDCDSDGGKCISAQVESHQDQGFSHSVAQHGGGTSIRKGPRSKTFNFSKKILLVDPWAGYSVFVKPAKLSHRSPIGQAGYYIS